MIDPESFDGRRGRLILIVCDMYGEGLTSAEIAGITGWDRREVGAKLRSLVGDGIVESSSDWESPARYWARGAIWQALKLVGALAERAPSATASVTGAVIS